MEPPTSEKTTRDCIREDSLHQYTPSDTIKSGFTHLLLWRPNTTRDWPQWFIVLKAGAEVSSEQLPGLHRLLKGTYEQRPKGGDGLDYLIDRQLLHERGLDTGCSTTLVSFHHFSTLVFQL